MKITLDCIAEVHCGSGVFIFTHRASDRPASLVGSRTDSEIINILKAAHPMMNKHVTTFANYKDEVFLGITNTDLVS